MGREAIEVFVDKLNEDGNPSGQPVKLHGIESIEFDGVPFGAVRNVVTISLVQAAKCFGIGRTKAYELYHKGEFPVPVRNIAGSLRVRLKDIEDFLDTP